MGWSSQGVWTRQNEKGKLEQYYKWSYYEDKNDYIERVCNKYKCPQVKNNLSIIYGTESYYFFRGYVRNITSKEEAFAVLKAFSGMPVQRWEDGGLIHFFPSDIIDARLEGDTMYFTTEGRVNEDFMKTHFGQ